MTPRSDAKDRLISQFERHKTRLDKFDKSSYRTQEKTLIFFNQNLDPFSLK